MNCTDKSVIDIFKEILCSIKGSSIKEIIFIVLGAFLGFYGSYFIYKKTKKLLLVAPKIQFCITLELNAVALFPFIVN